MQQIADLTATILAAERRTALLAKIVASDDISGALLDGEFTILDVIRADASIVSLDGVISRTPDAPHSPELRGLLRELSRGDAELHSDALGITHPHLASRLDGFAGFLFVPFGIDGDFLAFFRREVTRSISWLGDLSEQNRAEILSPRLSFSSWQESVTGRSLPWENLPADATRLARDIENALLRRRDSRLATLAMRDPLTGLGNRRHLLEELAQRSELADTVSLLFIDLDEFKQINDTFGHEAGDTVIVAVGARLTDHTRSDDLVVRLGGDEFVIVAFDLEDRDAQLMGQRIAEALRDPVNLDGGLGRVTASIGVVTLAGHTNPAEMLERADAAMYRAKQNGKNQIAS
jgi:chemotaxis family two-component system sensor kinase Cph1